MVSAILVLGHLTPVLLGWPMHGEAERHGEEKLESGSPMVDRRHRDRARFHGQDITLQRHIPS
jgi:hypothetical protein